MLILYKVGVYQGSGAENIYRKDGQINVSTEKDVIFNEKNVIKIDAAVITDVKERTRTSSKGRFRLCLQHSSQDKLHEMIIARNKDDYGRPDKHMYSTESHTIIDGAMLVILFEDNGDIREIFELSKECYYTYRIDTNIYHMQIPITEQVVYYEVKQGQFNEKSNIFPEWAPHPEDRDAVCKYMLSLKKEIKSRMPEMAERLD